MQVVVIIMIIESGAAAALRYLLYCIISFRLGDEDTQRCMVRFLLGCRNPLASK